VATVVFWVLMIIVLALLFEDRHAPQADTVEVEGPAFTWYLFSNTRAGLIWRRSGCFWASDGSPRVGTN
jgi:hypothetical protein